MFLNDDEVIALTGKRRCDSQARVLDFMNIEYMLRPDGSVVVLRSRVEEMLGGTPTAAPGTTVKKPEVVGQPNFAALDDWQRGQEKKR